MNMREIINLMESSEAAGYLNTLPTLTLRKGTILYHGTDAIATFSMPRGPAFFTASEHIAQGWIGWGGERKNHSKDHARVLKFQVTRDIELIDLGDRDRYEETCEIVLDGDSYYPPTLAEALVGMANGWIMDGFEVVLTEPETVLVSVP